jgi:pimeloyl-ACP methyl ester carboxylesterase
LSIVSRASRRAAAPPLLGHRLDVDVDGFRGPVHVRLDGADGAPPLLLVHGFGGSMAWMGPAVAPLAQQFRVIRIDLLGHAATGGPAADAPLQARAVEAILARLDARDVTAVGHSFGADVVVELAERSRRIRRLVIITQAPDYSTATLPRGQGLVATPRRARVLLGVARTIAPITVRVMQRLRGGAADSQLTGQALSDLNNLNPGMLPVVLVARRERLERRPLDEQVRASGTPALAILGGRDHFYGDRAAARYRAAGARVEVLPQAGHSPLLEDPDAVVGLIRDFAGTGLTR